MLGVRRPRSTVPARRSPARGRAVLLATLDVPFDAAASAFAVDAAVEAGAPLIVANVVELPPLVMSVSMGYDRIDDPELTAALREPAQLAQSVGVAVERLRVKSPRPIAALLQLVAERAPGLLVFGPDRKKLCARVYRRAAVAVRERAPCLVWLPD